jgi:hypothetical protein
MKGSILLLSGWLLFAILLAGALTAPTPPGGVGFAYYLIVASLPVATFLAARSTNRISLAICFGLLAGFILSWPLFTDGQMHFHLVSGTTPPLIGTKVTAFTLLMSLFCAGSFWIGRRVFSRRETNP